MFYLTNDNAESLLNTGNELTAQCLSSDLQCLFLGVGTSAYMYKKEAEELLSEDEFSGACAHSKNKNPLFVHLDEFTLFHLLRREDFVITEDNDSE